MPESPSYIGRGLVNLVAGIEARLLGSSAGIGLFDPGLIPEGATYVLVLFDGLGVAQTGHPAASAFRSSTAAVIEAPFPTTTSVSKATVATGLPGSDHGLTGHYLWLEEVQAVVNTLKWVTPSGEPVPYPFEGFLRPPNLWERLGSAGVEPITVQPGDFTGSPLSRLLYRGARFEPVWSLEEVIEATVDLARSPRRFIYTYVPHVDVAGHVFGQEGAEFDEAMRAAVNVWEGIVSRLPDDAVLLGTADHGLVDVPESGKILVRDERFMELRFAGDSRGVQLWGGLDLMDDLASETGGTLLDPTALIGPEPTDLARARTGTRVLLAPDNAVILPPGFDKRLRCYHGGLSREEVEIPLLLVP
jgi:hypothetical protein